MSAPNIPEKLKEEMWQFFLKTSVPRLLEKKKRERLNENAK